MISPQTRLSKRSRQQLAPLCPDLAKMIVQGSTAKTIEVTEKLISYSYSASKNTLKKLISIII
jgi:hypothetical protein